MINKELENFIEMSKYAGERFDLIQAGGGNTSVKIDQEKMYIKASGYLLEDLKENYGYVEVDHKQIAEIYNNPLILQHELDKKKCELHANELLKKAVLDHDSSNRPSIETFLHAILYKYTLHTHPIVVNIFSCQSNWEEKLHAIFPEALLVKYETPGIDLGIELKTQRDCYIEKHGFIPKIIFLQNHGLIVSADTHEEVISINESVIETLEKTINVSMAKYRLPNRISQFIKQASGNDLYVMLSEDQYIKELINTNKKLILNSKPMCPDTLVFTGFHVVELKTGKEIETTKNYIGKFESFPRTVLYENNIFFVATSKKKAREAEDVFKAHLIALDNIAENERNYLFLDELKYLNNWDAEKFRQKI